MSEIAILGDIAFNGIISSQPEKNRYRFDQVSQVLSTFDFVFANLELPVTGNEENNEHKQIIRFADKAVTRDLLQRLNIGCVSLANNHVYDCKMSGLQATIGLLDELGIYHTGAGWKKEHIEPVIIEKAGSRIGFMAYVDKSTNPKTEFFPELLINYLEVEKVISDISQIRNCVDMIICSIHWGIDYSNYFSKEQRNIASKLVKGGSDIIMGHHSHAFQPYEVINGKYVFYGLGQLCFGDDMWEGELRALKRKTKLGIIPVINSNRELKEIIPTRERKGNYIEISKINITRKLRFLFRINRLMLSNKVIKFVIRVKESFIDRFSEFCFGYYRNPFKEIFKLKNFKKVSYLFRDYRLRK